METYESTTREIARLPSDEPATIELHRAGRLRVIATDAAGAVPAGCEIFWRLAAPGPGGNASHHECRPGGASLGDVPPGQAVLIVARADGLAPAVEGPVVFEPGASRTVTLVLREGAGLRIRFAVEDLPRNDGRAYLPQGILRDAAGVDWSLVALPEVSVAAREIRFAPIPPGRWTVRLGDKRETVHVKAGEERVVDLTE